MGADTRDASEPDLSSGLLFGSEVALQLFRHGTTWQREKEVRPFTDPAPVGMTGSSPIALQVAGNHVATTMFVMPDAPPGGQFPCFRFGSEAWSLDHTN